MIINNEEALTLKMLVIKGYCIEKRGLSLSMIDVRKNVVLEEDEKPFRYQIDYTGWKIDNSGISRIYKSINHAIEDFRETAKEL